MADGSMGEHTPTAFELRRRETAARATLEVAALELEAAETQLGRAKSLAASLAGQNPDARREGRKAVRAAVAAVQARLAGVLIEFPADGGEPPC